MGERGGADRNDIEFKQFASYLFHTFPFGMKLEVEGSLQDSKIENSTSVIDKTEEIDIEVNAGYRLAGIPLAMGAKIGHGHTKMIASSLEDWEYGAGADIVLEEGFI